MKRFIQGEHRTQNTLFTEILDDYVTECNPVRVVEVFVEGLDLGTLGFKGVKPEAGGHRSPCLSGSDTMALEKRNNTTITKARADS